MKNKSRYALTGVLVLYGALSAASTLFGSWSAAGLVLTVIGGLSLMWSATGLIRPGQLRSGNSLVIGGVILVEAGAVVNDLVFLGTLPVLLNILRILFSVLLVIWYLHERKQPVEAE